MKRGASSMLVSGDAQAADRAASERDNIDLSEGRDTVIEAIRYQRFCEGASKAVPSNAIAALALTAMLYTQVALVPLFAWVGLLMAVSAIRYGLLRSLARTGQRRLPDTIYLLLTFICGALWGGVVFLVPMGEATIASSAVVMILVGLTAGSAIAAAPRPIASIIYNIPPLAGLATFYMLHGGVTGYMMAGMVVCYLGITYRLSRGGEADLIETLGRNQDLETARNRVESQARALKELARRHETAARRAEEATQAKSSFLANISHEIRTPLNGLMSLAHNLEKDTELTNTQRTKVRTLRLAGDMMMRLVGDLLDFSKIEAGRMTLVPGRMTMAQLAHDIEALWSDRAAERQLEFAVTCDGPSNLAVSGDSARLKQVIFNLVTNALKFTDTGRVDVRLSLTEAGSGTTLRAEVSDTGPGVPREAQGRLFKDYSQLDGASDRRLEGAGLGLAISRRLVELMDGQIGHMPGEPSGSVFWFEVALPRAGGAAQATATPAKRIEPTASEAPEPLERPLRILAAEDNAINRSVLEGFLMSQGWSVDFAENGREAVDAAHARAYDVILMDMRMPVMDGLAATRAIRDLPTTASMTPIVALTANARPEDEAACLAAGMDGYVSKPIDARRLFGAISQAISSASEPASTPRKARSA